MQDSRAYCASKEIRAQAYHSVQSCTQTQNRNEFRLTLTIKMSAICGEFLIKGKYCRIATMPCKSIA